MRETHKDISKVLELLIVVFSFLKCFELMRVTDHFGKNVILFFKSIVDMKGYMAFFFSWMG